MCWGPGLTRAVTRPLLCSDAAPRPPRLPCRAATGVRADEGSLGVVLGLAEAGAAASGGGGRDMRMMAMASAAEGMPVEGGDLDLAASITVTWELTTG